MWSYFVFKNITYIIRNGPLLRLPAAKSTSYDINSVLFRACVLRNSLPQSVKYSESIVALKTKLKDLGNTDCSCIDETFDINVVCSTAYGCCVDVTLVSASTGYIFTIFIVMMCWFLLASAIVPYQRKIKLLN